MTDRDREAERARAAEVMQEEGEPPKRDAQGRWLPGYRGNPSPAQPGDLVKAVREVANDICISELKSLKKRNLNKVSNKNALAIVLWDMALQGDLDAIRLLLNYTEGKPPQHTSVTVGPARQRMDAWTEAWQQSRQLTEEDIEAIVDEGGSEG